MVALAEAIERLNHSAADYIIVDDHAPGHGHVVFQGQFSGRDIVWDCHILPLLADGEPQQTAIASQYIFIPPPVNTLAQRIDIGLNVHEIDTPTLLKSIIMVRQYRNLAIGRHEWK